MGCTHSGTDATYQRRVGFLAGNTGLYARLSVRRQLDCWARIAYIPRDRREETIARVMRDFDLTSLAAQRSDRLSMGQRQRLRLDHDFIGEPDLVLLDEPRNSLDSEGGAMLHMAIRGTVDRGGAGALVFAGGRAHRGPVHAPLRPRERKAPGRMRDTADAAAGLIRRDWSTFSSYRTQLISTAIGLLTTLTIYHFISKLVGDSVQTPEDYFAFLVVGMVIFQVLQSTMSVASAVRGELVAGTFERLLLSPFGAVRAVVSMMFFPFVMSLISSVILLTQGALIFGVDLEMDTAWIALPLALLGTGIFTSLGMLLAATTLAFKRAASGLGLAVTLVTSTSGVDFPIALLPGWLQAFSSVQPFTAAVDLLRTYSWAPSSSNRRSSSSARWWAFSW